MVNQAEQPTENMDAAVDSGNTTTDITEEFAGVNTFEDVSTAPDDDTTEPSTPEGQEAVVEPSPEASAAPLASGESAPAPAANLGVPPPESLDTLSQRLRDMESQNAQYQQQQYRVQLSQQAGQYRQQLEQQGYLPEQADQLSQRWMAQQDEVVQLRQNQEQEIRYLQGQANAAEHYANKYDLQLSDLTELRKYQDPQAMEEAAKRLKSDRGKDARIAELEARLVPTQSFDDSQSTPAASNNENTWLDKYNQGDRSEQAQAAARRAAGLG